MRMAGLKALQQDEAGGAGRPRGSRRKRCPFMAPLWPFYGPFMEDRSTDPALLRENVARLGARKENTHGAQTNSQRTAEIRPLRVDPNSFPFFFSDSKLGKKK